MEQKTGDVKQNINKAIERIIRVMIQYKIPLVPPITLLNEAPISFTVSAASFRG